MARLEAMETFVRVLEAGSISAAAERMGVTKSVVSRRIAELEERLGAQLFRRTTRRLNPTDTAQIFYQRCVRILADVQEAEDAVCHAHGALRGRLRVAMPLSFGLMHLVPAIDAFADAHPEVEFDLDFNDREVDLVAGDFDVAIRIGKLEDSSLRARRLADIHGAICASPDYLQRNGTPRSPRELAEHRCLTYSNLPDPDLWTLLDADARPVRVRVRSVLSANNGNYLRDAAIAGKGIVSQPTFIAHAALADGRLQRILHEYTWPALNAYAVYPQTRHLSRRVRALVDFLAGRYAGTPYWDAGPD